MKRSAAVMNRPTQIKKQRCEKGQRRRVNFQDKPNIAVVDDRGAWHSGRVLREYKDSAVDLGRDAHRDGRLQLWSATFEEPVSDGLLCMWTTHSNGLRGLEKIVSISHGRQAIADQKTLVREILDKQRELGSISEALADISRKHSGGPRQRAQQLGKADEFAVVVDDIKAKRQELVKAMMKGSIKSNSDLPMMSSRSSVTRQLLEMCHVPGLPALSSLSKSVPDCASLSSPYKEVHVEKASAVPDSAPSSILLT